MGFDDGVCESSPTGEHQLQDLELRVAAIGVIDRGHACIWCGVEAVELGDQDAARPPL